MNFDISSVYLRCVVLVSLPQYVHISNKTLLPTENPPQPGSPGLQEPDQLVEVVSRDLEQFRQDGHGLKVEVFK